jgi:hypothetical protein
MKRRRGIRLEFGDIIFYSIAGLVVITLIWLKFIEPYLPVLGVWIVWIPLTVFLISRYEGFAGGQGQRSGGSQADKAD